MRPFIFRARTNIINFASRRNGVGVLESVVRFNHKDSNNCVPSLSDTAKVGEDPRKKSPNDNLTNASNAIPRHVLRDTRRKEPQSSSTNVKSDTDLDFGATATQTEKTRSTKGEGWSIRIDKSGLMKSGSKWPTPVEWTTIEKNKEISTPLVKHLKSIIKQRGPMSVHDYMSQVILTTFYPYKDKTICFHYFWRWCYPCRHFIMPSSATTNTVLTR